MIISYEKAGTQLTIVYLSVYQMYDMTTLTSQRGTSTVNGNGLIFKKVSSKLPKNETITINLGTKVVKAKDIPNVEKIDLKGQRITVNRGTDSIIL